MRQRPTRRFFAIPVRTLSPPETGGHDVEFAIDELGWR